MTSGERVAVLGTGLSCTSLAMGTARFGALCPAFDPDRETLERAAGRSGLDPAPSAAAAVEGSTLVLVCTPIASVAPACLEALRSAPEVVVSDVASVKSQVMVEVASRARTSEAERFVVSHPMGGSERSGPEFASESVLDGIAWVVCPGPRTGEWAVSSVEGFARRGGGHPVRIPAERHDRLVAFLCPPSPGGSTGVIDIAAP